jgi:hypothetical protein
MGGSNRRVMVLGKIQADTVVVRTELGTASDNNAGLMAQ